MREPVAVLGTSTAVFRELVIEKLGWFRRSRVYDRDVTYLEWTIDGTALRDLVAWPNGVVADEVTPIQNEDAPREFEREYLNALLGSAVPGGDVAMPDGRVVLLGCHADFDLHCRALTVEVVLGDRVVEWRDVAWQSADEALNLSEQEQPVVTLKFDRQHYEAVVRSLLRAARG